VLARVDQEKNNGAQMRWTETPLCARAESNYNQGVLATSSCNPFSQSLFAQSRKWRSALASQSMTGERVEQNASRDYERHHQKRCEKSCIVTAIDIALAGHEPT
jgi:peptide methionine sulfoxide reductase MsrB